MKSNLVEKSKFSMESKNEFEKRINIKLKEHLSKNVKKDYSKNEVLISLQEKIKKIKNFEFLQKNFRDIVENKRKVLIYCDYDNDGLSSGVEMASFLDYFKVPYTMVFSDRKNDGYGLKLENLSEKKELVDFINENKKSKEPVYICSLDNGVNNDEVNQKLKNLGITYCSIDHHQPDGKSSNEYCMNPHLNPENISDEENLCTGLLVYGFCLSIFNEKEQSFKKDFMLKNIDMAVMSTLSDYMKLDGLNRGIVKHFSSDILRYGRDKVRQIINNNDAFFQKTKIYETLSGSVISLLNAVGRLKNMHLAYDFLRGSDDVLLEDLIIINEGKKQMVEDFIGRIKSIYEKDEGKVIIYDHDDMEGGITSIISSRLAITENKLTMIGHSNGFDKVRYSIRSPFFGHILGEEFEKLGGYKYKGHNVAGVVEIPLTEKDDFEKKVIKYFNEQNLISEQFFVIDTIKNGEFITSDLLDMMYSYGPYGAGLKEPVFKVSGDILKGSNQLYISRSASGKTQLLKIKIGNKVFRLENNTGRDITEEDIKKIKEPIVRISYPYPNSNENVLKMLKLN